MTPYVDFVYFVILLYPLVPAMALGLFGQLRLWYVLLSTLAMLLVQYGNPLGGGGLQLAYLAVFTGYEMVVVLLFALLRQRRRAHTPYYVAVALTLLPLAAVKVYPLLLGLGWWPGVGAPAVAAVRQSPLVPGLTDTFGFLGVSYMTFRVLDVIINLQDGLVEFPRLGVLLSYVLFFPCASAGPIDRYRRFVPDVTGRRGAGQYALDAEAGIYRVAQGFLYKFIIAQVIYTHWLVAAGRLHTLPYELDYMYAYSLYLFFDFAGYSAFAIGISRFFGVRTPENFRAPFLSRNFRDFWNRWFITLSWFLRDHIYMRFVLGATRRRWFKNRYTASYIGYMLTMGAMGVWHGLELHYIVYGLYQGVMLVIHDFLARFNQRRHLLPDNTLTRGLSIALTFNLVCFGMLIFSGHLFQ